MDTNDDLKQSGEKKPYSAPVLTHQKHLRDITLNPTPGQGESGGGATFRQPMSAPASGSKEGDAAGGIWEDNIFDD